MNALFPFFKWCEATSIGSAVRGSQYAFAVIESIHLVGLAVLGGAVLWLNLRMLGFGLSARPVRVLAAELRPLIVGSLVAMVVSGIPLFLCEATRCFYSGPFRIKIIALLLAVTFTATVQRRLAFAHEDPVLPLNYKFVGLVSSVLWFTVAAAGRWIAYT
jgi:hypothetical protein